MKTRHRSAFVALTLTATLALSACAPAEETAAPTETVTATTTATETITESATPSATTNPDVDYESADLLRRLVEEEKVAHDLYLAFEEQYGARIFTNIKNSEVKHQDFVLAVMETTGVEDPRLPEPGKYVDPELQALYDDLYAQGSVNLPAAYQVGVDFEVLDIAGLEAELAKAPESDTALITLLENLISGSKNHLAAFQRQVDR